MLTRLEKINDLEEHNVKQFGLLVSGEVKQVVLLPDLNNNQNRQPETQSLPKKRKLER